MPSTAARLHPIWELEPSLFPSEQTGVHMVKLLPAKRSHRIRTAAKSPDENVISRADRLAKRDRTLAARYYYWTEVKRVRFDDVEKRLADCEFFLDARTVTKILAEQEAYLNQLYRTRPSMKELAATHQGFDFTP